MPELPEVEVTRLGLAPLLIGQTIANIKIRNKQLRWPIPNHLAKRAVGQKIRALKRRGKYLLLELDNGTILIHLGMSGHIRTMDRNESYRKHDHVILLLSNGETINYHDPRRFGAWLWLAENQTSHVLLDHLGVEPLSAEFNESCLYQQTRGSKRTIKALIMDQQCVAGVGNIYATESLYHAGIHPLREANTLNMNHCKRLVTAIKKILQAAITQGGTTLKDFAKTDGQPGYFSVSLHVYGRDGERCLRCKTILESIRIQNRATVFCGKCQKL